MNRRGFLRGLGALAATAAVPDKLLAVTDFIERKSADKSKFVNHMTIQRKSVRVTGSHTNRIIWMKFEDKSATWINHP